MVNLQHNLTVDDLIVEYMIYKVNHGYEPQYLASEFMDFLKYFQTKMEVVDVLEDKAELFKRFMERKTQCDWQPTDPHMVISYSNEDNDYKIAANYRLSCYDKSVINTYFMDEGMSQFDDYKGTAFKIRNIIGEYLESQPKRIIDENTNIADFSLIVGKYLAAGIIEIIWTNHIKEQIEKREWPEQCKDIDKYLFEIDLAEIIGLKSIKKELLDLYKVISKRIAILYQQDKNLQISNGSGSYLAMANYKLLINGFEDTFRKVFGPYKSSLDINLVTQTLKESHDIGGSYFWDDDPVLKTTTSQIGDAKTKKLVQNLEQN